MSLFSIRPGIEAADIENYEASGLPLEAHFHAVCAAVAADYVKLIKDSVLPAIGADKDFSVRDMQVLSYVNESATPITAADIVKISGLDPATVTRSVRSLSNKDYLTTLPNEKDSRSRILVLTKTGEDLAEKYAQECREIFLTGNTLPAGEAQLMARVLEALRKRASRLKNTRR